MVKAWLRSALPYEGMGHGVNEDELEFAAGMVGDL